uniref:perilipin-3-like n=1 Tax=Myxine glutinosa TaxID=7769 RepID=UPI00358FFF83
MAVEVQTVGTKNVFQRLYSLPLFSSVADDLVQAYKCGKESRPVLLSFGNMVEQGVTGVAVITSSGVEPITRILHLQIKFVDELACRGLDLVEEKVPILHQPANKVLDVTKNLQIAQKRLEIFLDWSKSQVGVGFERSKQVVLDGADSLLKTKFGQVVLSGADSLISQVDRYLPQDKQEGATPDEEKVVVPSSSSLDLYRRLVAVSSKTGREVFRKSSAGIQVVAESGRARLTGVVESLKSGFDSIMQKTPLNQEVEAKHQDHDSDRSCDVCKSSTGTKPQGKQSK